MPSRPAVYNAAAISTFLARAMDRRVSVAFVGDSNTLHAGNGGHCPSFRKAWGSRFSTWGSGVFSANPLGGYSVDSYRFAPGSLAAGSDFSLDLPATHAQWQPSNTAADWPYGFASYAGPGTNATDTGAAFMSLFGQNTSDANNLESRDGTYGTPFNPTGGVSVNWQMTYATFAAGGGTFYPNARETFSGNYFAQTDTTGGVNCQTGVNGLADYTLAIPDAPAAGFGGSAGDRSAHGVQIGARRYDGLPVTGKVALLWQQVEAPSITSGVAFSLNLYQGGHSTWDAVQAYRAAPLPAKIEWLRQVVRCQNGAPMLLVHIIQGQNDTGVTALSLGPHPAPSNTTAGLVDNHEALILEIRSVWMAAAAQYPSMGFDLANLYFLVGPYHPQGWSRKQWITDADGPAGLPALADRHANVAVALRNERHATTNLFIANLWYEAWPSDAHLVNWAAYDGNAQLTMQQLVPAAVVMFKGASGLTTLKAVLWQGAKALDVANGSLDVPLAANYSRYALAMTEVVAGSGVYSAVLPVSAPPGDYVVGVQTQAGASLVPGDAVAAGTVLTPTVTWDGISAVSTVKAEQIAEAQIIATRNGGARRVAQVGL